MKRRKAGIGERRETLLQKLAEKCRLMVGFLLAMSHPDGRIALFNDAAFGIEAEPGELTEYYERLVGEKVSQPTGNRWAFPETGYYVMSPIPGDRLIIDCGPVGPDYPARSLPLRHAQLRTVSEGKTGDSRFRLRPVRSRAKSDATTGETRDITR